MSFNFINNSTRLLFSVTAGNSLLFLMITHEKLTDLNSVGKTALINRYTRNKFVPRGDATLGSDFLSKVLTVDDKLLNLQVGFIFFLKIKLQ